MTSSLRQRFEGERLSDLVKDLPQDQQDKTFGVAPAAYGESAVTVFDIVSAVPADLVGIINAATTRLGLIHTEEVDLLRDTS